MPRRSLKPQLNQIRGWVRQGGRTDAWIAHQLEVTVQQIAQFKRENELAPDDAPDADGEAVDLEDEIDLRASDDERIAAELEAEQARAAEAAEAAAKEAAQRGDEPAETDEEDDGKPPVRRRGRRGRGGAARRGAKTAALEGTFDHGDEGYGLWLDPAVADDPVYAEHWAGHRPVEVTVEADRIVIRRSGDDDAAED